MAKTYLDIFNSDEFKNSAAEVAKNYAIPALLLSAGTGVLGGHLASKNNIPHESKKERRKRILRAALFPALTAAAASTALGGAAALKDVDVEKIIDDANHPFDFHPIDFFAKNLLIPAGALAAAGTGGTKIFIPHGKDAAKTPLFTFHDTNKATRYSFGDISKTKKIPEELKKVIPRLSRSGGLGGLVGRTAAGALGGAIASDLVNTFLY